jgi:hypothetical protein
LGGVRAFNLASRAVQFHQPAGLIEVQLNCGIVDAAILAAASAFSRAASRARSQFRLLAAVVGAAFLAAALRALFAVAAVL